MIIVATATGSRVRAAMPRFTRRRGDDGGATSSDQGLNELSGTIVDAAFDLHKALGPGLLESVDETLLEQRLVRRGLHVDRQKCVTFSFDGRQFNNGFRVDLLVEERVVAEIKSVEMLLPVHAMQVLTYLRLLNLRVGLLVNFGAPTLKQGIGRIVNSYPRSVAETSSPPRLRVN